jgi:hypothetical protein
MNFSPYLWFGSIFRMSIIITVSRKMQFRLHIYSVALTDCSAICPFHALCPLSSLQGDTLVSEGVFLSSHHQYI